MALAIALVALTACNGGKSSEPTVGHDGGEKITIYAKEFLFTPKEVTTTAGGKTIELYNKGTLEHDFLAEGFDLHVFRVKPGASGIATTELEPGTYEFYCSIPGHREAGMVGTLRVT